MSKNQAVSMPLLNALQARTQQKDAPFYTPGHKRGQGAYAPITSLLGLQLFQADLPELSELDNLFAAQGVIQAAQDLAAQTFGAEQTWFLVNGSTCGVIAAILATCEPGSKIILPRNVHQSAIAALILSGAVPIFIQPEFDLIRDFTHSVTPESVRKTLTQHPDAAAVMLVYPTYYGVCADIRQIAEITQQFHVPLLVDEAHGAHFAFHPDLPIAALEAGADLTVQSTHKTLSALTQASMLHVQGDRIDRDRLSQSLQLVQSTSPSYLLLASLDAAREQMATQGNELISQTLSLADQARSRIDAILGLSTLQAQVQPGFFALDRTRLTVTVSGLGLDGFSADEILYRSLGVTAEFPSMQHLTFIVSLGNTESDIDQLVSAFEHLTKHRIDREFQRPQIVFDLPEAAMTPREAFFARSETVPIDQAIDRITAELICPYPPGIPVLLPGERITKSAIAQLQTVLQAGGWISGCADPSLKTLKVIQYPRTTSIAEPE